MLADERGAIQEDRSEEGGRPKSRETVVDHPRGRCGNFNKHWRKVQSWKLKAVARKALDDAQADHKSTDKFHNSHKPAESLLSSECVTYRSSLQFKMESASEAIKHLLWS